MSEMEPTAPDLEQAVQVLRRTPAALRELLLDLPDGWLDYREDPEAWSPRNVLLHYIHNERANWIPRARVALLEQDPRDFPPFQQMPDGWESNRGSVEELLTEFAELREQSLAELARFDLSVNDLDRQAIHPALGEVTLGQLLATWVVHDLNHLHQIAKTMSKRYRVAVGPWTQFLAILDL